MRVKSLETIISSIVIYPLENYLKCINRYFPSPAALQPNIIWIESNFVVQFYCFDMQKEIQSKPKRYIKNSKFNLFNFFFCEKIANEMELRKWFLSDYLYDCIQLRQSVSRFPIQFQNNTKLYELCMMSTTWNAKAYLKHAGT